MTIIASLAELIRDVCGGKSTRPLIQFIRYGIVGASATVLHLGVFAAMSHWVLPAIDPDLGDALRSRRGMINNTVAFLISNVYCYLLNAKYIFVSGRHSRWFEFALFFAVSAISFVLGTLLFGVLIGKYGVPTYAAEGAYILTAVALNYVCRRYIVFKT